MLNETYYKPWCFTWSDYRQKSSPMKHSSFHLFSKTFCSPPFKCLSYCEICSRVLDSWYYIEKYQCKRVACYCYQKLRQTNFFKKNFGKCSHIGCLKVRNSNQKTVTLSNIMLQNKSFMGKIIGNLAHKSLQRIIHKLFDPLLKM